MIDTEAPFNLVQGMLPRNSGRNGQTQVSQQSQQRMPWESAETLVITLASDVGNGSCLLRPQLFEEDLVVMKVLGLHYLGPLSQVASLQRLVLSLKIQENRSGNLQGRRE